jgi:hypothetical protein
MKHDFLEKLGNESKASNNVTAKNEKYDNDEMERTRVVMGLSCDNRKFLIIDNQINQFNKYTDLLPEVYMINAKTAVLENDTTLVKQGVNENEICIPKIEMDGLADYDSNTGYIQGGVSIQWQIVNFNYSRKWKLSINSMDSEETLGLIFSELITELLRTKAIPEQDAFRFARYANLAEIKITGSISTGAEVLEALQTAIIKMDNSDIPSENRHLFITTDLLVEAQNVDTTKSRAILGKFDSITKVPKTIFYTAIDLVDGKVSEKEKRGFKKSSDGKDINFLIVEKSSVMQFTKYKLSRAISSKDNPDNWTFNFNEYVFIDVYKYKPAGIYLHYRA